MIVALWHFGTFGLTVAFRCYQLRCIPFAIDEEVIIMTMRHALGIFLMTAGIALIFFGCGGLRGWAGQIDGNIASSLSDATAWYLFDGFTASLFGLLLLAFQTANRS
jgi:hypothetical protein